MRGQGEELGVLTILPDILWFYDSAFRELQSFQKLINIQRSKVAFEAPMFCHCGRCDSEKDPYSFLCSYKNEALIGNSLTSPFQKVSCTAGCGESHLSRFLPLTVPSLNSLLLTAAPPDSVSYFRHLYGSLITSAFAGILSCFKVSDTFVSSVCSTVTKLNSSLHLAWNWILFRSWRWISAPESLPGLLVFYPAIWAALIKDNLKIKAPYNLASFNNKSIRLGFESCW